MVSEEQRRARLANQVLLTGLVLGAVLIVVSLWLGTSTGAAQATAGLSALGVGDLMVGLLVLLVLGVAVFSIVLGLKDRVISKIGLRNVTRARSRTMVLLLGLLVGSTIISSSLVIGDTVNNLTVHFTYIADGAVDEAVWAVPAPGQLSFSYAPFPIGIYTNFASSANAISNVQGTSPMMIAPVGAFDLTRQVAQPGLTLIGVDGTASANLGSFTTTSGASLAGPSPGEVLLNANAAAELSAQPGDHVTLSGVAGIPMSFTVQALVQSDHRGGFQDTGMGDVFAGLGDAQNVSGTVGEVNYVAVTNVGGLTGGPQYTNQVWPHLNASLASAVASAGAGSLGLTVHSVLLSDLLQAQSSAQSLTQLFLVLGLFSIGAGCVLIVGIFAMLAEERRGEMGVARAIGMRRGQLIRAYYFEGLAYSAGSALLGTLLGIVVGWGIIEGFAATFGQGSPVATNAIAASFTFSTRSLVLAYTAGFLLTLVTVTLTAAYVSRMNIVAAIRSLPEEVHHERSRRWLLAGGIVMAIVGALLFHAGQASGTDLDIGLLGVTLLLLSVALIGSYKLPFRYTFSASALALLAFWGYLPIRQHLFTGSHTGGIYVFFQEGMFLILAAVILYVFNSDLVVRALTGITRKGSRNLPVVRLAFSYPAHRRFRSGMTISIFAMVLFTITAIAAIGNGISSGVSNSVQTESGGYGLFGFSTAPIQNMGGEVANNSTLRSEVSAVVPMYTGGAYVSVLGSRGGGGGGFAYQLAAAPSNAPSWEDFYTTNHYTFSSTLNGMSPQQVWQELQSNPNTSVVDGSFAGGAFGGFGGGSGHSLATPGDNLSLSDPYTGAHTKVMILGILSEQTIQVILLNPTTLTQGMGFTNQQFFFMSAAPGVDARTLIQNFQTHFFNEGLELFDFSTLLSTELQFTDAFVNLLEVFVALGLIVGITALGILALRAVVERRTQIGVVRAVGFRRSQVLAAFLTEYSFLALMGIGIGAVMGLVLAFNLNQAIGGFFDFSIPWANLAVILLASYALTLVATGMPSFRASRIPPAEAIRYSE